MRQLSDTLHQCWIPIGILAFPKIMPYWTPGSEPHASRSCSVSGARVQLVTFVLESQQVHFIVICLMLLQFLQSLDFEGQSLHLGQSFLNDRVKLLLVLQHCSYFSVQVCQKAEMHFIGLYIFIHLSSFFYFFKRNMQH